MNRALNRQESWLHVPNAPGYLVSSTGRVVSHLGPEVKQVRPYFDSKGYQRVRLHLPSGIAQPRVHQIVATAFHGPCPEGLECRHLNGNKLDNRAENLKWGTPSENMFDRVRHGTHQEANKTHCKYGHPFDVINTQLAGGRRRCRACQRRYCREYRERKAAA